MSTGVLTERYVHEVVRRLPPDQRDDIARELRATIADTIEGRGADDRQAAEREVLGELGDPVRYAARYTDRPLALIGPDLYPAYIRVLGTLVATVLPALTLGFVLLEVADGGGLGAALRVGAGTVIGVGAQLVAAITLVFAVTERVRHHRGTTGTDRWTPDELPDVQRPDRGGVTALAAVAWDVLLFALIVWQHTAEPYWADGAAAGEGAYLEVLNPDLWSGWIWPVLAGLAGLAAVGVARVAGRGWTVRLAGWYALAHAVFTLPLAWVLYRQELFNPDFLADAKTLWESQESVYAGAAVIVLAMGVSSVVKAFRTARG